MVSINYITEIADSFKGMNLIFDGKSLLPCNSKNVKWEFVKRFPQRKGKNINTELWSLTLGDANRTFVFKYATPNSQEFRDVAGRVDKLGVHNEQFEMRFPFIKYAACDRGIDESCEVPILIVPYLEGEPLSILIKRALWKNKSLRDEGFERILLSCFSELKNLHLIGTQMRNEYDDAANMAEKSVFFKEGHYPRAQRKEIARLLDEVKAHSFERIVSEMSSFGTSYIHRDCFPHNFMIQNDGTARIIDWETLDIGTGAEDVAQMVGCLAVYLSAYGYGMNEIRRIDQIVEKVYESDLAKSLSYKLLLLKAVTRFSPFDKKCFAILKLLDHPAPSILKLSWFNMIGLYGLRYGELVDSIKSTVAEKHVR